MIDEIKSALKTENVRHVLSRNQPNILALVSSEFSIASVLPIKQRVALFCVLHTREITNLFLIIGFATAKSTHTSKTL